MPAEPGQGLFENEGEKSIGARAEQNPSPRPTQVKVRVS